MSLGQLTVGERLFATDQVLRCGRLRGIPSGAQRLDQKAAGAHAAAKDVHGFELVPQSNGLCADDSQIAGNPCLVLIDGNASIFSCLLGDEVYAIYSVGKAFASDGRANTYFSCSKMFFSADSVLANPSAAIH